MVTDTHGVNIHNGRFAERKGASEKERRDSTAQQKKRY